MQSLRQGLYYDSARHTQRDETKLAVELFAELVELPEARPK